MISELENNAYRFLLTPENTLLIPDEANCLQIFKITESCFAKSSHIQKFSDSHVNSIKFEDNKLLTCTNSGYVYISPLSDPSQSQCQIVHVMLKLPG